MQDWDDLRLFLATARAGSSRRGAAALGVNQSTVSRRIRQLEQRSDVRLFDRLPTGLVLTDAGEELLALAVQVEHRFDDLDRRLQSRDAQMRGVVRLSMPDFMVVGTAPHLAELSALHPAIAVEVLVDHAVVSLTHREADLVVRLSPSPPEQLVGRRIGPVRLGVYGAVDTLAGRPVPVDPSSVPWVRWEEAWRTLPPEAWIDANVAPEQVRARINTSPAHAELIAAGVGVGLQPCYTADVDPRLARAAAPMDFGPVLWLLTHQDLRQTARVRALLRHLGDRLFAERARFLGADSLGSG